MVKPFERGLGEIVKEWRVMIRAFEETGISLKVDDSEDAGKMKFQCPEIGIPPGIDIYQKRWLGLRANLFTNLFFE